MDEDLAPTWCMLVKYSVSKAEARSEEILIILWESSNACKGFRLGKASRGLEDRCRPRPITSLDHLDDRWSTSSTKLVQFDKRALFAWRSGVRRKPASPSSALLQIARTPSSREVLCVDMCRGLGFCQFL